MQEPVTVRVMGDEEPSTLQDRFSYRVSLLSSTGAKVTSKGTSMPGQIRPLAGAMDSSGGNFSVSHWNLVTR